MSMTAAGLRLTFYAGSVMAGAFVLTHAFQAYLDPVLLLTLLSGSLLCN